VNPNKSVACPWCNAEIGAGCVDKDGGALKAGTHMARYYARRGPIQEAEVGPVPLAGEPEEYRLQEEA
jgi:hypothetical protein